MSVSREDIINALKQERDEALQIVERCNAALAAFSVPITEPPYRTSRSLQEAWAEESALPPERPKSKARGISLDNINRAKARVKRIDQPFTRTELSKAMECAPVTAGLAIKALTEEGWIELVQQRPNTSGGNLYRYVPAKPDPKEHPRHDHPRETNLNGGRGEAVAGTGKGLRSTDHDINEIIRSLRRQGWQISKSGSDHYKAKRGLKEVRFSGSPPGQQAINAIKSNLRNAGANV